MHTGRVEEQEIGASPPHTDPTHFPTLKKAFIVIVGLVSIFNSNLGSSLPSNAAAEIESYFAITQHQHMVLLNSLYLVGYTLGPLVFGPLSEHIGRRPVLSATYTLYLLFTVGCALSPTYGVLLLFRTLSGIVAAAPNAVVGALFADIFDDPTHRGRAIATVIVIATMGPAMGPVVSGCTADISWRLCFWVGLALAGITWPLVLFLPETCQKVLQKRHRDHRRESGPVLSHISLTKELSMVFSRPFSMMFKEPIVLFTSVYLGLVYSILYLFFQAYPIIFGDTYNLPPRDVGLAFLPVSLGAVVAFVIFLLFDAILLRQRKRKTAWSLQERYARLPLACVGGPCVVVALFRLGSTSSPPTNPIFSSMADIFFGAGYFFTFFAMLGYLTDAYKQFSALAHAAASTTRSMAGVCLPFAAVSMYTNLGTRWACFVLGFAALAVSVIPFLFISHDKEIRKRSPYCQKIRNESDAM